MAYVPPVVEDHADGPFVQEIELFSIETEQSVGVRTANLAQIYDKTDVLSRVYISPQYVTEEDEALLQKRYKQIQGITTDC